MKKLMDSADSASVKKIFGDNLRRIRIQLRLRQRDLHLLTGIAHSLICETEKGVTNLTLETMVKLARAVKTPLWELLKPSAEQAPEADGRATPRSREWHDRELKQQLFDFSDEEIRYIRRAAATAKLTVVDFMRTILRDKDIIP